MASGDIVPIELGLTDGDFVTLWAPRWREGEDEWEAFLGHEDDLYGFESIAELAAFIRTDADNDLVDHPSWKVVSKLSAEELEPDLVHTYDLVGVPELAASDPDGETVGELADALTMVRHIGEVCELDAVTSFFSANSLLRTLAEGVETFHGRDGAQLWSRIGKVIAEGWDEVLDAVDTIVATPTVDKAAVAVAEAELLAAAENTVDVDDASEDADGEDEFEPVDLDDDDDDDDDTEDDDDELDDSFWATVGIDPIKIITVGGTYFTLRCYLDDEPIFLGGGKDITVFGSERALGRYLADDHEHDLAGVSTYGEVHTAAMDGSLEIEISDENIYVLPGLADDLEAGPESVDAEQLDLAVELFTDAADYLDDDAVEQALATSTPLGWYVSYILNPDPTRLAPSPPFTAEAEQWRALEQLIETKLARG
ncbi:MAG: primosomal protein [Mycobacteriaceae bacterium]|nr:primosomal protein [Mycobacteriaceae bacterium]